MKSTFKVLFVAIVIAQVFFNLNINAEEIQKLDISQIIACRDCKE